METDRGAMLRDEAWPDHPGDQAHGVRAEGPDGAMPSPASPLAGAAALLLAACGGGGEAPAVAQAAAADGGPVGEMRRQALQLAPSSTTASPASSSGALADGSMTAAAVAISAKDAARFLSQATFGPTSVAQIAALAAQGREAWLQAQFALPAFSHSDYLESQRGRDNKPGDMKRTVREEMSYEAFWQHWLRGEDQLRARVSWALIQIMVISNIAPDIRPVAMSSYMDVLTRNAFGNYRDLLREVTLHPAMGYYLNMLKSAKEDPAKGTHPNENYPREVLQLFSIGLAKLNIDGTQQLDGQGKPIPTYDEAVVKGYAKAFSGWSFGGLNNADPKTFRKHDENNEAYWRIPMIAWPMWHSTGTKQLLNGRVLPAGQSAEKDLADALDTIFQHPNVGPFFGRQMIQRLVTSNPSAAYIQRVAMAFNNNGAGVRGDMKAVIRAVLMDPEALAGPGGGPGGTLLTLPGNNPRFGKQREPVVRLAHFLRALGATSRNGRNNIHYLDSPDDGLAQSPLLAPSVFNFYSPNFRPAGPLAAAGLVAPEFQITSETSVVGSMNFFASVIDGSGVGSGDSKMRIDYTALKTLVGQSVDGFIDRLDQLFFSSQMSASTRTRMRSLINALPAKDTTRRVKSALLLTAMSPDYLIQK